MNSIVSAIEKHSLFVEIIGGLVAGLVIAFVAPWVLDQLRLPRNVLMVTIEDEEDILRALPGKGNRRINSVIGVRNDGNTPLLNCIYWNPP